MTNPDWERVKDLFAEALEQPVDLRLEFLKTKCNGDERLFEEVSSLLAASAEPENLIEDNAIDLASKVGAAENNYAEQHFGNYRIIREIGSGGMGTVFLAERDDGEFSMQVAQDRPSIGRRPRSHRTFQTRAADPGKSQSSEYRGPA